MVEFFGGIFLALGLFTRIAAAAFVIEMAVISFAVLYAIGPGAGTAWNTRCSWGIVALAIFLRGGGRCSLDRLIGREF